MSTLGFRFDFDFPLPLAHNELLQEHGPSLTEVFDNALSAAEVNSEASGNFVQNGLLFSKWVSLGSDFVGGTVVQLVVPATCWHQKNISLGWIG